MEAIDLESWVRDFLFGCQVAVVRDDVTDQWPLESTGRDPEVFDDVRSRNSDVDAFGVMLPELFVGCRAFAESTSFHIMRTIIIDGNAGKLLN
jgi:hypothetical protein